MYLGKIGLNRANWYFSGGVVVFRQSDRIRAKCLYSGKVVVFGQKWLYSGKLVLLGKIGSIW